MDSFDKKSKSKRNDGREADRLKGIYGIVKPGKYYFPGKISSGCFDGNGFIVSDQRRDSTEELYDIVSESDPDGMYTGRPKDINDVPVQDADDL